MAARFHNLIRRLPTGLALAALALLSGSLAVPSESAFTVTYPPTIGRANLDGSNPDRYFITLPNDPESLAADSEHVYWTLVNGKTIGRANLDGTGVDQSFIEGDWYNLDNVEVDSSHIYWTWAVAEHTYVGRANLDGSGIEPRLIDDKDDWAHGLAVNSTHIYWSTDYGIRRANLDGTVDPAFSVSSHDLHEEIGVGSGYIFWSHYGYLDDRHFGPNWIGRAKLDGTGVKPEFIDPVFGSGAATPIAVDSQHVYWNARGGIARANLDGTGVTFGFIPAGGTLAVGPEHVYWGRGTSVLFRIGKPKLHKRRGTATLPVKVFTIDPSELILTGKGIRSRAETAQSGMTARLAVRPKGAKERRLERRGRVKVTAEVTVTPPGGDPVSKSTQLKLIER